MDDGRSSFKTGVRISSVQTCKKMKVLASPIINYLFYSCSRQKLLQRRIHSETGAFMEAQADYDSILADQYHSLFLQYRSSLIREILFPINQRRNLVTQLRSFSIIFTRGVSNVVMEDNTSRLIRFAVMSPKQWMKKVMSILLPNKWVTSSEYIRFFVFFHKDGYYFKWTDFNAPLTSVSKCPCHFCLTYRSMQAGALAEIEISG